MLTWLCCPLHQPVDELRPTAVVLRSVVQVYQQLAHLRVALSGRLPPLLQPIAAEIARLLRGGATQAPLLLFAQKDAKGGPLSPRLEAVAAPLVALPALASPRA